MDSVLAGGVESIIIIIYLPVKTVLYWAIRTEFKVGPMSIQEPHLFLRRSLFSGADDNPGSSSMVFPAVLETAASPD